MLRWLIVAVLIPLCATGCPLEEPEKVVLDPTKLACPDPDTQYRSADGYCVCEEEHLRYDANTKQCEECEGTCVGKECGDDGCGRACGRCEGVSVCQDGLCAFCMPTCDGRECGADGCGGSCGACALGTDCDDGTCVAHCVPDCVGRTCGSDGCGGTCGTCADGEDCRKSTCVRQSIGCFRPYVPCNCAPQPLGAFVGATREEPVCNAGYVIFDMCYAVCYDPSGLSASFAWSEVCGC
jgi:hypothetical protein